MDKTNELRRDKLVSFIQHDLPGLQDGMYHLKLSQTIEEKGKNISAEPIEAGYRIAVVNDRFAFSDPASTVYSVFPADNASGKYDTVLPSVVFTKTTLPWARTPRKTGAVLCGANDTDEDVPTWLTILLLDQEDVETYRTAYPDFSLETDIRSIGDLFPPSVYPGSSLGTDYSYFSDSSQTACSPGDFLEPGQQPEDAIVTLDLPLPLFRGIAPTLEDLKYMAHVRKVSLVNKCTMPGVSDIGEPEGRFSIVFGNRLPGSNRKVKAYLVSLERLEDLLPSGQGQPDLTKKVRLAVLKTWSFYSTGRHAGFVDQLKRLNRAVPSEGIVNNDLRLTTALRLEVPEGCSRFVSDALQMGYVPMKHHLRTARVGAEQREGEKTVSWYRAPLTPYRIGDRNLRFPIASADQIFLYDPVSGMFDLSYAAAWALGRQIALQDKVFSTGLYNWKKQLKRKIEQEMEQEHLFDLFSAVFQYTPPESGTEKKAGSRSFIQQAVASLKIKNRNDVTKE